MMDKYNNPTAENVGIVNVVTITRKEYDELLYMAHVYNYKRRELIQDLNEGRYVSPDDINRYMLDAEYRIAQARQERLERESEVD